MRACTRALAALVAASAMCAAVTATATANRIRVSSTQIRHTWPEWTINLEGGFRISCPITLEGSIHSSTISKVFAQLVAHVTRPAINAASCTGGSVLLLAASLPWHIKYDLFSGTLPNITALQFQFVGMAFLTTVLGTSCLYQTTAASPAKWIDSLVRGVVTSTRWVESVRIPSVSGGFCPAATLSGSGSLTHAGTTTALSITLI
jgi:hypothetical protein